MAHCTAAAGSTTLGAVRPNRGSQSIAVPDIDYTMQRRWKVQASNGERGRGTGKRGNDNCGKREGERGRGLGSEGLRHVRNRKPLHVQNHDGKE